MRNVVLAVGAAGLLASPIVREIRLKQAAQPLTDAWQRVPIARRGSTLLGISFRSPQVTALGLAAQPALETLLDYPFQIIRLGAYWNRIEPSPGAFDPSELDGQVAAAARAGKQIILAVGAMKTFGYPEFFAPAHQLGSPLPEHTLITPSTHPSLLAAATGFVGRIVERYRSEPRIVAWQVEQEAVDALGFEHSWRLATAFVQQEVATVRRVDPMRPILLNGFLPTALPGRLSQWWQTRDQGDSLAVAEQLADIVGIDYYPRYALAAFGPRSLYLDGTKSPWLPGRPRQLLARAAQRGARVMVSEGQAERWEAVTIPPDPPGKAMASCLPEQIIHTYNACQGWPPAGASLYAYLFWGAEYWLLRQQSGDASYLQAFGRVLRES